MNENRVHHDQAHCITELSQRNWHQAATQYDYSFIWLNDVGTIGSDLLTVLLNYTNVRAISDLKYILLFNFETIRKGVYYLSVGAAGFLIFILGLAVLRVVVFCLLWLVSVGRHHLWLFPNLTEDVGFFASFWPLWKVMYLVVRLKLFESDEFECSI